MKELAFKIKRVTDLASGATIGIPNDPSNGGRGLLLLQQQGLITTLVAVYHSDNMRQFILDHFDGAVLPVF